MADIPNLDAFSLVTSGQSFVPSAATEALVTKQRQLLVDTYGAKGQQIIDDAQADADGVNAYWAAHGINQPPATVNDVIAVTAFIGSIFGAGGGGEASNADLLAKLQGSLGPIKGHKAWDDVMLADDPEAPTTIRKRFNYPPLTGGPVTGSVVLDANSIQSLDPRVPATTAAAAPAHKEASNFLITAPRRSATGNSLAVMGPQLGYYYPEIVEQVDLHGPGIDAQGVAVPGLNMYILIGRTPDYAWSLTSADDDVRDVYAERLCEPDGSAPTRASTHYLFRGECRPFESFDAGLLNGQPIRYPVSVHGPVFGTATVHGQPYALTRKRSTFGRDALNLAALKDMTDGKATTPRRFWSIANEFGFTFNWGYISRKATAYFSSGLLPRRPRGLDRRLPTLGTGHDEWTGFLSERQHPHDTSGPARASPQLEQPLGPRLHARRRRAVRVRAARGALQPVAEARAHHRQRRDHEPGGHRGRPRARVARRQPGAPHGAGAERARPGGRRHPRRLGGSRRALASMPTATGSGTSPGR